MTEQDFWAALDTAVPGWRDRRMYPLVFAAVQPSRGGSELELVEDVVASALGPTFEPAAALDDALDVRLDRVSAHAALERGLIRTPAYNSEWVDHAGARRVADTFVACFGSDTVFRTNGHLWLADADTTSWTPLTTATFDTGIVAVGPAAAGVLWVTDED